MPAMTAASAVADSPRLTPGVRCALAIAACVTALATTGCWNLSLNHRQAAAKPILPPLVTPKDALILEIYFIERGAGDPLLGEALWQQLDEMAIPSPDLRARLRAAGLRVGLAGSSAPSALRAAYREQHGASGTRGAQNVSLLAGSDTPLEAALIPQEFTLRSKGNSGETVQTYRNARCVLRVSGERQQEGWVRLRVQPELHHGAETIQPAPGVGEWKLQQSPKIDRFYEQSFDVELNLGELVVIGAWGRDQEWGESDETLGARFFRSGTLPAASERVLVIRVADVQQIDPVRSDEF